jgi:hypothetical protein
MSRMLENRSTHIHCKILRYVYVTSAVIPSARSTRYIASLHVPLYILRCFEAKATRSRREVGFIQVHIIQDCLD